MNARFRRRCVCQAEVVERSVLELVVGGVPYPHGRPGGDWRYRHAVQPEGPTVLDCQAVADFVAYEERHGRKVEVHADPALSDWPDWPVPTSRHAPSGMAVQCCTHVLRDGCTSSLVCHGTPVETAASIFRDGMLQPATAVSGRPAAELAAASTWGEPPDYFEHVMFAHGRCTAPEAVAHSRRTQRDLVPSDLDLGYPPAVRFYFRWDVLSNHPRAVFDGVHPVKIHGVVDLADLAAVVVHSSQAELLQTARPPAGALVVLDLTTPSPAGWASAADREAQRRLLTHDQ
jgi:hypothetical protein